MFSLTNHQPLRLIEPELLFAAYTTGYFPMADSRNGPVRWYSPDPRAIIPLNAFKIPRSLRLVLKKNIFDLRINTSFEDVIRCCADREETWISEEIIQSYLELHRNGNAHCVEAWHAGHLVGGLYGVTAGAAFFGESMFSRERDASKAALVFLVERLKTRGYELLDTQFMTLHLAQFGTVNITRTEYLALLKRAISKNRQFVD